MKAQPDLSDNEGSLLALVLRRQPVTAYQLLKIYEQSPVSSFNESKGSLYPLIRRMKARGLLAAAPVAGDGRGAEALSCTAAGQDAARGWAKTVKSQHVLPDDPLRTKALSLHLLDVAERSRWIEEARALTEAKAAELSAYFVGLDLPLRGAIAENAEGALRERLRWLDRLAEDCAASLES